MAISINHLTKVISIPKTDTTFVLTNATTGYEVRSYSEYALMRELADYLDSEAGMGLPSAFTHATQVTISGVVYARSLLFLSPYTITFETGSYQVNLIGGTNNNMLDVLNPNAVSVIAANSAGLQTVAGAGDPWTTALPGAYGAGTAGNILGTMLASIGARMIEGTLTQDQITRIMLAGLAGKRQGLGTATEEYMSQDNSKARITLSPDPQGNGDPIVDGT